MHTLALRWALWATVLFLGVLMAVGSLRFLLPPDSKVPLDRIYRFAWVEFQRGARDTAAESIEPPSTVAYGKRHAYRVGLTRVSAGKVDDFPIPSVTYLSNLKVFLVRSPIGFTALTEENPVWFRTETIVWDRERQWFTSRPGGERYTWLGDCLSGPCRYRPDRFTTRVDGDDVIVDASRLFVR